MFLATEDISVTKEIFMSPRMGQVKTLLEQIELMKTKIIEVQLNTFMPSFHKKKRLEEMQAALDATEYFAMTLMQQELDELDQESFR